MKLKVKTKKKLLPAKLNLKKLAIPAAISLMLVVFAVVTIISPFRILGATLTFIQSSWAGGAHADTASDAAGNKTGWTKYSSADANISAGSNISLTTNAQTNTQTTDSDFNAGTLNGVAANGSGSVIISSYNFGSIYSGNLASGSQTFSSFGYTATIPAGASLQIMFSEDLINWYSASYVQNTWTTLQSGNKNLSLSGFPTSATFYYQLSIVASSANSAPTLTNPQVSP